MSILLFGADGQVGKRLSQQLGTRCTALSRAQCDIATLDDTSADALLASHKARWIVNAAAFTAVDAAEEQRAHATLVNGTAPAILARAAARARARMLQLSTDYVFDGAGGAPYAPSAAPNPRNHYGLSKWQAEKSIAEAGGDAIIVRLQWIYDTRGSNFFLTMKKLLAERSLLRVVADQFGAPSAAPHIATALVALIDGQVPAGTYHLASGGYTSWHGFACAIAQGMGATAAVEPVTSKEYPTPALRPHDTRLDCSALAGHAITMPHWRDGLAQMMEAACM